MSHLTPVPSDPEQLKAWLAQRQFNAALHDLVNKTNPEVSLPPAPGEVAALTIQITLDDTDPPVWRQLVVAGDTTLDVLHEVLQTAMGWTDSHLHRFFAGPGPESAYFVTDFDVEEGDDGTAERDARLDQLLRQVGDRIRYDYDFGDGWGHDVRLEQIGPLADDPRPRCTAGACACPPEDVGGPFAYAAVAAWVRAGRGSHDVPPPFEDAERALTWLPPGWDPDAFDADDVDLQLQALDVSSDVLAGLRPEALEAVAKLGSQAIPSVATWLAGARKRTLTPADIDDLTRPYRHLLAAVGGGVPLSAAGYLPADVVERLCPLLGIHPALAGKANRESNVRPLLMFRKTAQDVGLLHARDKLLMPTVKGIQYGDDPANLWQHLTQRLPLGRTELKRDVGWYTLLALAADVDHRDLYSQVHELCVAAGWSDERGAPISFGTVNPLVWPTVCAVVGARWNNLEPWPAWVPDAAAALLFSEPRTP